MRDLFPSCVARAEGRYMAYFSGDVKKKEKKITLKENASTVQISLVFFFKHSMLVLVVTTRFSAF